MTGWRVAPTLGEEPGRYPSGQRGLTVDQLAECLRRFESFPPHHRLPGSTLRTIRPLASSSTIGFGACTRDGGAPRRNRWCAFLLSGGPIPATGGATELGVHPGRAPALRTRRRRVVLQMPEAPEPRGTRMVLRPLHRRSSPSRPVPAVRLPQGLFPVCGRGARAVGAHPRRRRQWPSGEWGEPTAHVLAFPERIGSYPRGGSVLGG